MKIRLLQRQEKKLKRLHGLKIHQNHQTLWMTQERKNRGLKRHQAMEKKAAKKTRKKLKRPNSPKKHQKLQCLLIKARTIKVIIKRLQGQQKGMVAMPGTVYWCSLRICTKNRLSHQKSSLSLAAPR